MKKLAVGLIAAFTLCTLTPAFAKAKAKKDPPPATDKAPDKGDKPVDKGDKAPEKAPPKAAK